MRHGKFGPPMSALGQKRTLARVHIMSALAPKADMDRHGLDVRFVPEANSCTAAKRRNSITSSAAGSLEKQKIDDDESCDYATGVEGEHVADVVSGHALARLDCCFDDPFVVPFRHQASLC